MDGPVRPQSQSPPRRNGPEGRVRRFLETAGIAGGRLLVGVSGGADSVALLRLLIPFREERELEILVGHFDHGLRSESAADALWVEEMCRGIPVPCLVERMSDGNAAASEERLRSRRHEFLQRVALARGCRWVALAHTADDQAETVLHHILRGSGLRGASGIPAVRSLRGELQLVRPLLDVRRAELLECLTGIGQGYREDPSNSSSRYTRNRLRHELLPRLRREVNPQVDAALLRLAAQAEETHAALEFLARELLPVVLLECRPNLVRLRRTFLKDRPVGLVREMLSLLWREQDWPRREFGSLHLAALTGMAIAGDPVRVSLPAGLSAAVRGDVLEIRR